MPLASPSLTYASKYMVAHTRGHNPGHPIDCGAKLGEGHQLAGADVDVTPKCMTTAFGGLCGRKQMNVSTGRKAFPA